MIKYKSGGIHVLLKVCQMKGSVFPKALVVAVPCGALSAILKACINIGLLNALEPENSVMRESAAWSGFSFFVGFLIVFRTSEAYNRFWEGCTSTHAMRAEWFDSCSALVAFCKHSKADEQVVRSFQGRLVRLFSMLHATALADIEDKETDNVEDVVAYSYELIDAMGVDQKSLDTIKASHCKVELIYQWIQQLIVENIETGVLSIPPPILSRAFQEIANGMVAFHEAMKISFIPFPFPYAQTCDWLLIMHWLVIPFVVSQWVEDPFCAAMFTFVQSFTLWSLNFIAVEIENPFGMDANDIDGRHMQVELNHHLLMLLRPGTITTPHLSDTALDIAHAQPRSHSSSVTSPTSESEFAAQATSVSFKSMWTPEASPTRRRNSIDAIRDNVCGTVQSLAGARTGSKDARKKEVEFAEEPEHISDWNTEGSCDSYWKPEQSAEEEPPHVQAPSPKSSGTHHHADRIAETPLVVRGSWEAATLRSGGTAEAQASQTDSLVVRGSWEVLCETPSAGVSTGVASGPADSRILESRKPEVSAGHPQGLELPAGAVEKQRSRTNSLTSPTASDYRDVQWKEPCLLGRAEVQSPKVGSVLRTPPSRGPAERVPSRGKTKPRSGGISRDRDSFGDG